MNFKKKIYIWTSDISQNTGEGILCRNFLYKLLSKHNKIIIQSLEKKFDIKKITDLKKLNLKRINQSLFHKYLGPLIGISFCWKNYILGHKVIYLNYLPLWNIFIFLFLPPKTILGPVTGSKYFGKIDNFSALIRKFIFPILYYFNSFILRFRFKKVIFSTNLLRDYLPNNKKFFYNFVFTLIEENKYRDKNFLFDIVFYYREHITKNSKEILDIINLLSKKYKICIFGDKLKINNCKNYGRITNNKVKKILNKSKITFASSENLFSIFVIEALNKNVHVLYDKNLFAYNGLKNNNLIIPVNFNNLKKTLLIVDKIINNQKFDYNFKIVNKNIKKHKMNLKNFLEGFLV
jgi:hypothetical protein